MISSRLKQQEKSSKKYPNISNPLKIGLTEYKIMQETNNRRVFIDRIMFIFLGLIAIWAFYSALASLIL